MSSKSYLDELNESQRAAVEAIEGPVMIIAGAGSGKTRVLTYRIAHLMKNGVDPFNILALTFTNKAAREMKERISGIVPAGEARSLWMGTFHSVFAKILRTEAEKIGYPDNFTIYDTDDSKNLIKMILKEQGLDEKVYKPALVFNRISAAKNMLISSKAYSENSQITEEDRMAAKPRLGMIYEQYAKRCFKAAAMDFDDLLYKTNILLRDHPDVLHKYQHKFRYIMVDEYQDTNFTQYLIVKQLAALYQNICVVGDDAQSIYSFRGANIQNILNFEKDYPDLKTFKLEQNYRSTKIIVNAANNIIENNRDQLKKTVWTDNAEGEKIKVIKTHTDNEEGNTVAGAIFETKMNQQAKNSDFVILYRTNAQSRAMEEALRKLNIPYRIYGGLSFYQRKEIKDLLAYFRLAINNHDEESLRRVINYPARGIGDTSFEKMAVAASDNDISIWTVMENLADFDMGINPGTLRKIGDFATTIKSFSVMLPTANAYDVGSHIATASGILKELYTDKTPEGVSRHENIQELLNGLKEFSENKNISITPEGDEAMPPLKTLDLFMRDIALLTDADKAEETEEDRNRVALMTIHAAKGLEFPYVFIVGLEENLFPSQLSLNSRTDLEEERRLFYVALTRAEKKVVITYANTRYRWGNLVSCEPSRFIDELDTRYLELSASALRAKEETAIDINYVNKTQVNVKAGNPVLRKNLVKVSQAGRASGYDPDHLKHLQVGMSVSHEHFGTGKVVNMEGSFPNNKATVFFEGAGQKQLLLKFAKLNIIA